MDKRDVQFQLSEKRLGWGQDADGKWRYFVPRTVDGTPILDYKEGKELKIHGTRQYGFTGRAPSTRF